MNLRKKFNSVGRKVRQLLAKYHTMIKLLFFVPINILSKESTENRVYLLFAFIKYYAVPY